jgi:hypothetical protein
MTAPARRTAQFEHPFDLPIHWRPAAVPLYPSYKLPSHDPALHGQPSLWHRFGRCTAASNMTAVAIPPIYALIQPIFSRNSNSFQPRSIVQCSNVGMQLEPASVRHSPSLSFCPSANATPPKMKPKRNAKATKTNSTIRVRGRSQITSVFCYEPHKMDDLADRDR